MNDFNIPPKVLVDLLPESFSGNVSDQLLINDLHLDSRCLSPGDLFVAIKGSQDNGERYISSAVENGAVAVLVENHHLASMLKLEIPVIGLDELKENIGTIASNFFGDPSCDMSLVGITGTNGKSSIASFIAQIQKNLGDNTATIGTLGYGKIDTVLSETGMTTPDIISLQRILYELRLQGVSHIAMEVSSHGIDQKRVDGLTFDVGVISNITQDHLDYHASFKSYADTKRSFLLSGQCKTAVVNVDDNECQNLVASLRSENKSFVTYGIDNAQCDVHAEVKKCSEDGVHLRLKSPWGEQEFDAPVVGKFNVSNLLAAITVNCIQGKDFASVVNAVSSLHPLEGRMQAVKLVNGDELPKVYIDYAHTPDALTNVLQSLRQHVKQKLWVVFGCGGDRDKGKRALMGEAAAKLADYVVVTSDNPRTENPENIIHDILSGIRDSSSVESISERQLAIYKAVNNCANDDLVLIAGKGHEDYQIIGKKKIPFSDYVTAENALRQRRDG